MERRTLRLTIFRFLGLALLAVAAGSAYADATYTITLTNGTSFQTRYTPVPADWDDNVVMINSDRGNWIGVYADEIADVSSHAETTGFGYQLDTTTLFVGWAPSDFDDKDDGQEGGKEKQDLDEMFPEPQPSGVLEQFVDIPGAEGGAVGSQAADSVYFGDN